MQRNLPFSSYTYIRLVNPALPIKVYFPLSLSISIPSTSIFPILAPFTSSGVIVTVFPSDPTVNVNCADFEPVLVVPIFLIFPGVPAFDILHDYLDFGLAERH